MILRKFAAHGALKNATVLAVFQMSGEAGHRQPSAPVVVTPRHPTGKALIEEIIRDNSAALDALAGETREVKKR